jgi:hypothetical protein
MKRKVLKQMKKDNAISISNFLFNFYGCKSEYFDELSHKDLRFLMPYLIIIPMKDVMKDKESLLTGEIILVSDRRNFIVAYENPRVDVQDYKEEIIEMRKCQNKVNLMNDDISNLNKYELLNIYKLNKLSKNNKNCRYIKKEMEFRFPDKQGSKQRTRLKNADKHKLYKRSCEL